MSDKSLKVGWSFIDITPPGRMLLHGQFYNRVSEGVLDPVTATALALEGPDGRGGTAQGVMVSCDLVMVSRETQAMVRQQVAQAVKDLDVRMIFISATHTHDGPCLKDGQYMLPEGVTPPSECGRHVAAKVTEVVRQAWEARSPGSVSWSYGQAVVGHNRRASYSGGSSRMYGKTNVPDFVGFEGYEDHGLNILTSYDAAGKLTGMVVNLACPSQVTEHLRQVSADYWHETRLELKNRFGEGLYVLGQCSPAGDQSPHLLMHKELEQEMRRRLGITERQDVAVRIADGVERMLPSAAASRSAGLPLRHSVQDIDLPVRLVTDEEYEQAQAELERLATDTTTEPSCVFVMQRRNNDVVRRYRTQKPDSTLSMELHALRVGEVVFATNSFELFLDYGLRIKARSKAIQSFLVQLACDGMSYLPTEKAVSGGHYGAEVASNAIGPAGGQVLVERTLQAIDKLFEQ